MRLLVGWLVGLALALVGAEEKVEPLDIWDDAEVALVDFIAAINAALVEADEVFDSIANELRLLSADGLQQAEESLQVVVDFMDREVADIRAQETDDNREMLERCISEYADEMKRVPEYVRELITECVTNLDLNTNRDLGFAKVRAHNYLSLAGVFRAEIDGCYVVTDGRECISRVFVEILLNTLEVPTNIQELARRTRDILEFYAEEIPYCSRDRINGAITISNTIIRYIRSCADVVLNPSGLKR